MDRYKCIEAFVQIVETGGISNAAKSLNVSKSTISERLAQLEHHVGEQLVVRSPRRVALSSAGKRAYPTYRDMVLSMRNLAEIAGEYSSVRSGVIRIASTTDIGAVELARLAGEFCRDRPSVELQLSVGNDLTDPLDLGYDLAVHFRRMRSEHLKSENIADIECALYASPQYLRRHGEPKAPADLRHHACLGYSYQKSVFDWTPSLWAFEHRGERSSVRVNLKSRSNSGLALSQMAAEGLGIVVLPRLRAQNLVEAGKLAPVLTEFAAPTLTLFAIYPRTNIRNMKLQSFVRHLREGFSKMNKQSE